MLFRSLGGIENYSAAPTSWQLDQIKVLQSMLAEVSTAAQTLTKTDLEALNKMMRDANVPYIAVPAGGGGFGGRRQ